MARTCKTWPPKGCIQFRRTYAHACDHKFVELTINFRGTAYVLLFIRDSTLTDLIVAVTTKLHIPDDKQTYFISPNGAMLRSPFKDLSLALHTLQDKKIRLIGTTYSEAATMLAAETRLQAERNQLTLADSLEDPFDFVLRIPGIIPNATSNGATLWVTLLSIFDLEHLEMLVSSGYLAPYLDPEIDERTRKQLAAGLRILYDTRDISQFRSHAANIGMTPRINNATLSLTGASQEGGPLPQTWNEYDGHCNPARLGGGAELINPVLLDMPVERASPFELPVDTLILGPMPRVKCVHWPEAHLQGCLSCDECRADLFIQWSRYIRKHLCRQVRLVVQGMLSIGESLHHLFGLQERIARLDYETLNGRGFVRQESAVEEELTLMMNTLALDDGQVAELEINGISEDDVVSLEGALHELELERRAKEEEEDDDVEMEEEQEEHDDMLVGDVE